MIKVFVNNVTDFLLSDELIEQLTFSLHKHLGIEHKSVSLALVDNDTMQSLNKQYSGIDSPTDVLSFPESEVVDDCAEKNFLGEIIIATEVLLQQAPKYNNTPQEEFCRLFIHGFLHLIGYDHQNDEQSKDMKHQEDVILNDIVC